MSWSLEVTGSKSGASAYVVERMEKLAAGYLGKAEADDILVVKDRLLALIEAMDLSQDGYTNWNAVTVKANGSHALNAVGLVNASAQFSVTRTSIAL